MPMPNSALSGVAPAAPRVRLVLLLLSLCCAVSILPAQRPTAEPVDFDAAVMKYREWIKRPSLYKRTAARITLAATLDPRALGMLIESHAKPEEPKAVVRNLIATIAMSAFGRSADSLALARWRDANERAEHAWLWFETQRYTADRDFEHLREQAMTHSDPYLRSVALEAVADRASRVEGIPGAAALCLATLAELPRKEVERALAIEGVASILAAHGSYVRGDEWRPVAEALIDTFDDDSMPHHAKVVVARQLARIFDCPNLGFDSHWWRGELASKPRPTNAGGGTRSVPFASLRTTGFRFAYVIDASDSMLQRVTDRERKEFGPTTGGRPKPKPKPGEVPDADDIDWRRVVTRFDAAREFLRVSLRNMSDEHEFVVVLFGDEAKLLDATPKLVKATPRNIQAAIAGLDAIEAGPPTEKRPIGQLMGKTNLHAGFTAAFAVTGGRPAKGDPYVDGKSMLDGCDTLFVLSDGAPSWDDFAEVDAADPGDQAGDQETGRLFENKPQLIFQGPFARSPFDLLVADVRRLNLFRRAEINCVGIGEANHRLLKSLADVGGGTALKIDGDGR